MVGALVKTGVIGDLARTVGNAAGRQMPLSPPARSSRGLVVRLAGSSTTVPSRLTPGVGAP